MRTLLVINSSARINRSITRRLSNRFVTGWKRRFPDGEIVQRDVGTHPPSPIDESWIAAAFAGSNQDSALPLAALRESESLINELAAADAVVIGAPMYNFGMPAALKAYIDQIVRVGRTFAFNAESTEPYIPLLISKPVVLITSTGAGGYEPGGPFAALNLLEPHLRGVLEFIGLREIHPVRVGFEEFHDERLQLSIAAAEKEIDGLAEQMAGGRTEEAASVPLSNSRSL